MSKEYSGRIKLDFMFSGLVAENGETLIDALFPNGFEGELLGSSDEYISCVDEETGEETEPNIGG